MIVRKLNDKGDWTFGKGREDYARDLAAIEQNIRSTVLSWLNDCFFDTGTGIDWRNLMGSKVTADYLALTVKSQILACYGVTKINSVDVVQNSDRGVTITYNVDTIYSQNFQSLINQGA